MGPFKYLGIIFEDIAMYFYDKREYNGAIQEALVTTNKIEETKWNMLSFVVKIPINSSIIPTTPITEFSNPKHVEIDGVDDSFFRGIFAFAVFMIPQTLLLVFILKRIFCWIANFSISIYLRRYYFVTACVLQILIESNVSFFTYLFFRQMMVSFSFQVYDKLFLALSVTVFFFIMVSACCFYFLANYLY